MLNCKVEDKAGQVAFLFTAVYGLHSIEDRKALWRGLLTLSPHNQLPWLHLGDFHSILASDDRWNGSVVSDAETTDFLEDGDLTSLPSVGHYYSWSNKGEGHHRTCSRIGVG